MLYILLVCYGDPKRNKADPERNIFDGGGNADHGEDTICHEFELMLRWDTAEFCTPTVCLTSSTGTN